MYRQYLPDLVQKWTDGEHGEVANELSKKSYLYLPFFCADLYQTIPDTTQALIELTTELSLVEEVHLEPSILESRIEELMEEWSTGTLDNQDHYDNVARQLLERPRCETISFCAALIMKYEENHKDEWNMFRLGLLAGAFVKNGAST